MKYVVGENFLCFFALMEIILNDIGISIYNQYDLANYFGVVLPVDYKIKGVENVSYSTSEKEYGFHGRLQDINVFLEKHDIPLTASYLAANPFDEYPGLMYIPQKRYAIFLYSYGSLYKEASNDNVGHASLLIANEVGRRIKIYDPGPRDYGEKTFFVNRIYDAIYDNRGGIFIFNRK